MEKARRGRLELAPSFFTANGPGKGCCRGLFRIRCSAIRLMIPKYFDTIEINKERRCCILDKTINRGVPLKGYIYAVLASAFYALISILGKLVFKEGADPLSLIFYQYAITTAVLALGIRLVQPGLFRVSRVQLKQLGMQGILGAFATNMCFFFALQYLNAGIASMLLFTNPVFVTLFFSVTGIKVLKSTNYIALVMAMAGSVLVLNLFGSSVGSLPLVGIVLGLGSSVAYAFLNIYADLRMTAMSPYTVCFYTNLYGTAASGVLVVALNGGIPAVSAMALFYIILMVLVAGVIPIVFFYKSVALIGSERTSIVATLELPFTLFTAFLVLGEQLNVLQGLGVLLVLGAAVFLHWGDSGSPAEDEKQEIYTDNTR